MNQGVNFWWAAPSRCQSWSAWRWYSWDIRKGWDGPYRMIREHGFRLFGLEVSWEVVVTSENC